MKMKMAMEMINNGKMPGCISIPLHCSNSRPCIHLKEKALHSPWGFGNLGKACTMSPELSMWGAVQRRLGTLPSSKEIEPLLSKDLDLDLVRWAWGVQLYTRVQDNKNQNWQLDTKQEMWKVLQHISLLPQHTHTHTRWSGNLLTTNFSQHLHHQTFSSVLIS